MAGWGFCVEKLYLDYLSALRPFPKSRKRLRGSLRAVCPADEELLENLLCTEPKGTGHRAEVRLGWSSDCLGWHLLAAVPWQVPSLSFLICNMQKSEDLPQRHPPHMDSIIDSICTMQELAE